MDGFLEEYIKVKSDIVSRVVGPIPFDIYIQRAEGRFTKIFVKGFPIDRQLLEKYRSKKGGSFFFIQNSEKQTYHFYVEKLLEAALSGLGRNSSSKNITLITSEMLDLTLEEVFSKTQLDQKHLEWIQSSMRGCHQVLHQDMDGMIQIMKSLSSRPYAVKHSFMVSIFSLLLARTLGFEAEKSLVSIGLGAMLHDIGMGRLSADLISKKDLSPQDWKEIKEHPQIGYRMISQFKWGGPEVATIVLQHHEQPNGLGYPNGIRDKEIYAPAKIVAIADVFTSLITKRPYQDQCLTPSEAFLLMQNDVGRLDQKMVQFFIKIFIPEVKKAANWVQ
jgi:putative nucleotidyltransferase with HDIG domain